MRQRVACILLLIPLFVAAQKVENTKAEASGDKIIITYDLTVGEPGDRFTVSLFASHNNFSAPVTRVVGDVGQGISEGRGKRIEWDSKSELGKYKGSLTFEISAVVVAPLTLKTDLVSTKRGKSIPLRWRGGDQNQNVKIELLKGGELQGVVGTPSNKGSYEWNVPSNQKTGKDYSLRLVNGSETVSSPSFAIKPKIPIWVKISVPLVAAGVLLMPKSEGGGTSSDRLTAPPSILD
jgi:hypothetical protein